MIQSVSRNELRKKVHGRIRKSISGSTERPRLNVFKSLNHIYTQLIDDETGQTLVSASTLDKEIRSGIKNSRNLEAAKLVGRSIAQRALAKGIKKIRFDRGGYPYHGRVKALAEAAREGGLEF